MERKFKKARWPCNDLPRKRVKATKKPGRWTKSAYTFDHRRKKHSKEEWLVDRIMRFEDWAWEKKMKRAEKKNRVGEVLFMANLERIYLWWRYGEKLASSSSSEEDSPEEIVMKMEAEMFGPRAPPREFSFEVESSDYDSIPREEWEKPSTSYEKQPETPWTFEPKPDSPYWTIRKRRKVSI